MYIYIYIRFSMSYMHVFYGIVYGEKLKIKIWSEVFIVKESWH